MTSNHEHRTLSSIPIDPLYSPAQLDSDGFDPAADLGNRGSFPLRGARTRPCTGGGCGRGVRLPGSGRRAATNERYRFLLAHGQTGVEHRL